MRENKGNNMQYIFKNFCHTINFGHKKQQNVIASIVMKNTLKQNKNN